MGTGRSDKGRLLSVVTSSLREMDAAVSLDGSSVVEAGSSDLSLFRAGKIGVDEYIDLTVDRAVAHLTGQLPEEKVELMREVLRNSLRDDPHLSALAQRAIAG